MTEGTWNQIISTLGAIILGIVAAKGSGHVTASEAAAAAASTPALPPAVEELSRTVVAMATHMADLDAAIKQAETAIETGETERDRLQEQITREHAENRAYFQELTASIRRGDPIPDPPESWADDGGLQ